MKKFFLIMILSSSFSIFANAAISCLDDFNNNWNNAWDIFDLDKYNCLVDPFAAPFNCEEDAYYDRIAREESAVNSFDNCCAADPTC